MPCRTVNNNKQKLAKLLESRKSHPWRNTRREWCIPLLDTYPFQEAGVDMEKLRTVAAAAGIAGWGEGSPNLINLQLLDGKLLYSRRLVKSLRRRIQRLTLAVMNGENRREWLFKFLRGMLEYWTKRCVQYFHKQLLVVERAGNEIASAMDYKPKFGPLPLKDRGLSGCGACSNKAVTSLGGFGLCFVCADNVLR